MCVIMFNSSHRPHGKIADKLASTPACATANASVNYTGGACHRDLRNFPSPPWATHVFAGCLQGGGVRVEGATVSIVNSHIYSNTAVRAHAQKFPSPPMGKLLTHFCSILACTTANDASVNYSRYVPQRPDFLPSPRWEIC
jgi:hypothetical protein